MGQPYTVQQGFRGRNDDGGETGASWIALLDTNWVQDAGTTFRVRILLQNTGDKNETDGFQLRYSHEGGTYTLITTTSSVVKAVPSANDGWTLTDEDATTQQISSGNFNAGRWDNTGTTGEITITSGNYYTELEFCLQIVTGDVTDEDTIALRVYFDDGTTLDAYTTGKTPSITVNIPARTVSKAESVTLSDTPTVAVVTPAPEDLEVSEAESLGLGDAATAAMANLATSQADSLTLSATSAAEIGMGLSASDGLTLSATPRHYTETLVLLDRTPVVAVETPGVEDREISEAETLTLSDTPTAAMAALVTSHADSLGLSDTPGAAMAALFSDHADSLGLGDTPTVEVEALATSQADNLGLSDTPTVEVEAEPARQISVADSLTFSATMGHYSEMLFLVDQATAAVEVAASGAESLGLSDTPAVEVEAEPPLAISEAESLGLSDTATVEPLAIGPSGAESLGLSDTPSVSIPEAGALVISEAESLALSDAVTAALADLATSQADNLGLSDTPAVSIPEIGALVVSEAETLTLADAATAALDAVATSQAESLALSDTPAVEVEAEPPLAIAVSDNLGLAESPAAAMAALALVCAETLGLADSAAVSIQEAGLLAVAVAESLVLGDLVTAGPLAIAATVAETLTLADAAWGAIPGYTISLSVSESLSLEGQVMLAVIQILGRVTVSDSAASGVALADAVASGLTMADALTGRLVVSDE